MSEAYFMTYFDGVLVQNPLNESALQNSIKRDSTLNGIVVTHDGRLVFGKTDSTVTEADPYAILIALFDSDVACNEVSVEITYTCSEQTYTVVKGLIKTPEMTVDRQMCQASCIVQDDNFYSRINNNKSIKIDIASTITKNGTALSPVPLYDVAMFDPATGVYGDEVIAIRVKDLLEFQIAWMSDGQVLFESDFLDDDSISELFISTGYDIRVPGSPDYIPYQISFDFVYQNLRKLFNLTFFIEKTTSTNTFRLEKASYFYDNTDAAFEFTDIKQLKTSIKRERVYGQVEIGSGAVRDAGWLTFTESTRLFGFNQEQYFFAGQCNLDNTLDVQTEFVTSSNVIQDTYIFLSEENDDDFFLIECENVDTGALTADAKQYTFFGGAELFYNLGRLANNRVLENYVGFIPSSIVTFLGDKSNGFKATPTADRFWSDNGLNGSTPIPAGGYIQEPFEFSDDFTGDNFDGNNNYNAVTSQYVVPAADIYTFNMEIDFATAGFTSPATEFEIFTLIKQYASDGVTLKDFASQQTFIHQNGDFTIPLSASFLCAAGDIIQTRFELRLVGSFQFNVHKIFHLRDSSFFAANIGTLVLSESRLFKATIEEFRYFIPPSDYVVIEQNPLGLYSFEKDGVIKKGYIDDLKYNWYTKEATIKLVRDAATYQ